MKLSKKLLSLLLCMLMLAGVMPVGAFADESNATHVDNNMTAYGTNPTAQIIAEALTAQEEEYDSDYWISDVYVESGNVIVEYHNVEACNLVVAAYTDDNNQQMITSEVVSVDAESKAAEVTITETLPAYYVIKAFLLDKNNAALCKCYTDNHQTKAFCDLISKTTDDFDEERIINADDSKEENFFVLNENVEIIQGTESKNIYNESRSNPSENKYVFDNCNSEMKNLTAGELFYLDNGNEENLLVIKVKKVEISGNTVTVIADGMVLSDAFEHININMDVGTSKFEVDESSLEEGVTYNGTVDESENGLSTQIVIADEEESFEPAKLSFEIKKEFEGDSGDLGVSGKIKFSASVSLGFKDKYKIYVSTNYTEISNELSLEAKLNASVSAKGAFDVPIGAIDFGPFYGVFIGLKPTIELEISAEISLSGTLTFTVGFGYDSNNGVQNKSKGPDFKPEIKVKGEFFVGINLKPRIYICSESILKFELQGTVGLVITAEMKENLAEAILGNENKIHDCNACIDGEIKLRVKIGLTLVIGESTFLETRFEATIWETSCHLADFYFSITYSEFGFGQCPHLQYRVQLTVKDESGNPIAGAKVFEEPTGADGTTKAYFTGNTRIYYVVIADGYENARGSIYIKDSAVSKTITMKPGISDPNETVDPSIPVDPDNPNPGHSSWQEAYRDYLLMQEYDTMTTSHFSLLYINNDDIPELIISGKEHPNGVSAPIVTFANGKIVELGGFGTNHHVRYLEKQGYIYSVFLHNYYEYSVYKMTGDKCESVIEFTEYCKGLNKESTYSVSYGKGSNEESISKEEFDKIYNEWENKNWTNYEFGTGYELTQSNINSIFKTGGTGSNDGWADSTHIRFGSYPQSKVTDSSLISTLNSVGGTWKSYGYYSGTGEWDDGQMTPSDYMRYTDVMYGGTKYRGVKFSTYRPIQTGYRSTTSASTQQDDNGYTVGNTYWFKYEPLVWRVLDSSTGLVMCESTIDSQAYNNYIWYGKGSKGTYSEYYGNEAHTNYANDYYNSSIRKWLTEDFYATAFSESQQKKLLKYDCDNSCYFPSYPEYDSQNSSDKVFLLSYDEVKNTEYGFNSDPYEKDSARRAKGTDYAKCQGLWDCNDESEYDGNSFWWLRSPSINSFRACGVDIDGSSHHISDDVYCTLEGVRPALKLNLTSLSTQSEVSTQAAKEGTVFNYTCSACEAGGEYILLNVTGYGSDFELTTSNLEYIDQLTADTSGTVEGTFMPRNAYSNSTTLLIGKFGNTVQAKKLDVTEGTAEEIAEKFEIKGYVENLPVDYKATLTFTTTVDAPAGYKIVWSNGVEGKECTLTKVTNSEYKVSAKLVKISDSTTLKETKVETVTVKTNFFAKLIAFFKGLFGSLPKYVDNKRV